MQHHASCQLFGARSSDWICSHRSGYVLTFWPRHLRATASTIIANRRFSFSSICSRLTWYLGVLTDDMSEGWLPTQECYGPAVVQSQEVHPDAKTHLYPLSSDCTAIAPDSGWILWRSSLTNPLFVFFLWCRASGTLSSYLSR